MFALLFEAAFLIARSKRGRRLAAAGALVAWRVAKSDRAREAYAGAKRVATDPRPRQAAARAGRSAAARVRRS